MPERRICPECGNPPYEDATMLERAAEPPRICSPLRCSAWRMVAKATRPHPITGAVTFLHVVDGGGDGA